MRFRLTKEQSEILKQIKILRKNEILKINAFAGTGKTTTLLAIAKNFPNEKILLLVYNKNLAIETRQKAKKLNLKNLEVYTVHSFAFKYLKLIGYTFEKGIDRDFIFQYCESKNITNYREKLSILRNFRKFCYFDKFEYNSLKDYHNDFIIQKLMEMKKFGFDSSLKIFQIHLLEEEIKLNYDLVLLDEAQDSNPITLAIFNFLDAKKVLVGDKHQSIYAFRKAINALEQVKTNKNLYLTYSFRFDQKIADIANKILTLKNEDKKIVGLASKKPNKKIAYITRTNSQIIEKIENLRAKFYSNKTANEILKPFFFLRKLSNNLNNLEKIKNNIRKNYREFFTDFKIIKTTFNLKLQDKENLYLEKFDLFFEILESLTNKKAQIKLDNVDLIIAVRILKKKMKESVSKENFLYNIRKIEQLVKKYLTNSKNTNLYIGTAHSCKGLEFTTVFIDPKDFEAVLNLIETDIELIEEINLLYVAVTRTIKKLNMDENLFDDLLELFKQKMKSLK